MAFRLSRVHCIPFFTGCSAKSASWHAGKATGGGKVSRNAQGRSHSRSPGTERRPSAANSPVGIFRLLSGYSLIWNRWFSLIAVSKLLVREILSSKQCWRGRKGMFATPLPVFLWDLCDFSDMKSKLKLVACVALEFSFYPLKKVCLRVRAHISCFCVPSNG